MPKYVKAKRKRKPQHSFFKHTEPIEMRATEELPDVPLPPNSEKTDTNFRIISGKKKRNRTIRLVIAGVVAVLIVATVITSLLLPTGIIEAASNRVAAFSFGDSYPVSFDGNEVLSMGHFGSFYYNLTDTSIAAFSISGKEIFSVPHGFSMPVLSVSESRCLVTDVNGTGVQIFNASKCLYSFDTKYPIYASDISRCGSFAVATKSEGYTSMVTVYDKNCEKQYEWYCPEEVVVSVAVSPDGESVAVATVHAKDGKYCSSLYLLGFHSADPVFSKNYDGSLIYNLVSTGRRNFTVITDSMADLVFWKDHAVVPFESDYPISIVRNVSDTTVICAARQANGGDSTFTVFDRKGQRVSEFGFSDNPTDFRITGKNILVLCDNTVYLLDYTGNILKEGNCGFGAVGVVPYSSEQCVVLTDGGAQLVGLKSLSR